MIEYDIDTNNRTITATFSKGWIMRSKNIIHKYFPFPHAHRTVDKILKTYNDTLSAKAKCRLDDTWNEEYGKNLAKQRLLKKWHILMNQAFAELLPKYEYAYMQNIQSINQ